MAAEHQAAYRSRHPERVRESDRAWKSRNPEKAREVRRAARVKWQQRHPRQYRAQKMAEHVNLHWRRRGGGDARITWRDIDHLLANTSGLCWYCPAPATGMDHAIPLTRGGTNVIGNLRPCCKACNSSKGRLTADEFFVRREIEALVWERYQGGERNQTHLAKRLSVSRDFVHRVVTERRRQISR